MRLNTASLGASLLAWALRLSALVKLISDSILVGFKAGAGLTIAMTQLQSLFGVADGGQNFFERAWLFAGQLGHTQVLVLGRSERSRCGRPGPQSALYAERRCCAGSANSPGSAVWRAPRPSGRRPAAPRRSARAS